jgi:hypothetical protein
VSAPRHLGRRIRPSTPARRAGLRSGRAGAALAAVALAGAAALVLAHEAPKALPSVVEARGGRLVATLDLAPAYPPDFQKQLSNGLTNVVTIHVALLPEHGQDPVALYGREVDVLYDVWEETYGVLVKEPATPRGRTRTFRRYEDLRAFLSEARGVDLGPVSELGGASWVVQTRVEVNPVSQELLERTREFIANPAAGGRAGAPSRSVLGAMASYLLRNADPGADVHVFRSAAFTAREVAQR